MILDGKNLVTEKTICLKYDSEPATVVWWLNRLRVNLQKVLGLLPMEVFM